MLSGPRALEDDPCPVPEATFGQIYRSSPQGLAELIETIPPDVRAMLAVYCYRRAHLASIGLAVAASCDEDDLSRHGGNAGMMLFRKSREAARPTAVADPQSGSRRKVTLASGTLRTLAPLDDDTDEDAAEAAGEPAEV